MMTLDVKIGRGGAARHIHQPEAGHGKADRRRFAGAMLGAFGALALLAGCTTPFEAKVQSFQALPAVQGKTFQVEPQRAVEGGLEFQSYASLVAEQLRMNGFVPAESGAAAEFTVLLDYGAGQPRERLATRPGSSMGWGWYSQPWRYSPRWWGSYYDPFWGPGWNDEVYSYTIYPSWVSVQIVRVADKVSVFEGRADTVSRVNDLPSTMPQLVEALFKDFPGDPARSKIVRLTPEK